MSNPLHFQSPIQLTDVELIGDNEWGYGPVQRWFVHQDLRGRPEDFRCAECEEVGCRGQCSIDFEAASVETSQQHPNLPPDNSFFIAARRKELRRLRKSRRGDPEGNA